MHYCYSNTVLWCVQSDRGAISHISSLQATDIIGTFRILGFLRMWRPCGFGRITRRSQLCPFLSHGHRSAYTWYRTVIAFSTKHTKFQVGNTHITMRGGFSEGISIKSACSATDTCDWVSVWTLTRQSGGDTWYYGCFLIAKGMPTCAAKVHVLACKHSCASRLLECNPRVWSRMCR